MSVSEAQYRAAVDAVRTALDDLGVKIDEVAAAANAAAAIALPLFREAIIWAGEELVRLARSVWDQIVELLKGAAAPVNMIFYALDWNEVRGAATTVQGNVRFEQLAVDDHWQGGAAESYKFAIKPQSDAAGKVGSLAGSAAFALGTCAAAGLAFYVALGLILVKFVAAMAAAVVAFGSAVFSWAGVLLIAEEAAVNTSFITGLLTTLTAVLSAQALHFVTLRGEIADNSVFTGGQWPRSTAELYSDATVTDGDAEWSFER